jgi:hypothetical protein
MKMKKLAFVLVMSAAILSASAAYADSFDVGKYHCYQSSTGHITCY